MRNGLENKVNRIKNAKKNLHDRLISNLMERLEDSVIKYSTIKSCFEYGPENNLVGEIDLLVIYEGNLLIFEIKPVDSLKCYIKALEQLERAKEFYSKNYLKVFTFYVCPSRLVRIK